jgi:hypothetical protein
MLGKSLAPIDLLNGYFSAINFETLVVFIVLSSYTLSRKLTGPKPWAIFWRAVYDTFCILSERMQFNVLPKFPMKTRESTDIGIILILRDKHMICKSSNEHLSDLMN